MAEKVTIYTLANELNVSASAVSRAFNPNSRLAPEKRKRILEAAEKAGYRQNKMASRLSQDSIRIGVLLCKRIDEFYSQLLAGVESAANAYSSYKLQQQRNNSIQQRLFTSHSVTTFRDE